MKRLGLATLGLALSVGLGGLAPTALAAARPRAALITLDMLSAQQGWAMNTAGQVLKTTDGGRRWTNIGSPALAKAIQRAAKDGSFYLEGPNPGGNVVASQGNGTLAAFPNPWTAWFTLPVAGDALQVWHTGDGGQQWTRTVIHQVAPGGSMGLSDIAAVGNRDAWVMAATQGLAGHVEFRVWRTDVQHPEWQAVSQGAAPNTAGLAFATGAVGVLAEGSNIVYGPHSAALSVTTNGGSVWRSPQQRLPLLPGNWATTVLDPIVVPHTQESIVAVLMQPPFPSKTAPLKTWWRLAESINGGQTWQMLPTTPDPVLADPPNLIMQSWITPRIGWVVVGARLFQTTDAGHHWVNNPLPPGTVINMNQISVTQGFVLMRQGRQTIIYRTQDSGRQWSRVATTPDTRRL